MSPAAEARKAIQRRVADARAKKEAEGWQFLEELHLPGRLPLVPGRRFQLKGRRGWWQFSGACITPDGRTHVNCAGPFRKNQSGPGASNSFVLMDELGPVEVRGTMNPAHVYDCDIRVEVARVARDGGATKK